MLQVKKSRIKNAGLGVFATKYIKKGTVIGELTGKRLNEEQFNRLRNTRYCYEVPMDDGTFEYIDSKHSPICTMARINGAASKSQERRVNVESFVRSDKRVFYQAIRGIKKGQELLDNYGPYYVFDYQYCM